MKTNNKKVNEKIKNYIVNYFGGRDSQGNYGVELFIKKYGRNPEGWAEISKTLTEEAREYFPREFASFRQLEQLFRGNAEEFEWYQKARELVMEWLEQSEEEAAKYEPEQSWALCEHLIIREVERGAAQFDRDEERKARK